MPAVTMPDGSPLASHSDFDDIIGDVVDGDSFQTGVCAKLTQRMRTVAGFDTFVECFRIVAMPSGVPVDSRGVALAPEHTHIVALLARARAVSALSFTEEQRKTSHLPLFSSSYPPLQRAVKESFAARTGGLEPLVVDRSSRRFSTGLVTLSALIALDKAADLLAELKIAKSAREIPETTGESAGEGEPSDPQHEKALQALEGRAAPLVEMGFLPVACMRALLRNNLNVELALNALLGGAESLEPDVPISPAEMRPAIPMLTRATGFAFGRESDDGVLSNIKQLMGVRGCSRAVARALLRKAGNVASARTMMASPAWVAVRAELEDVSGMHWLDKIFKTFVESPALSVEDASNFVAAIFTCGTVELLQRLRDCPGERVAAEVVLAAVDNHRFQLETAAATAPRMPFVFS